MSSYSQHEHAQSPTAPGQSASAIRSPSVIAMANPCLGSPVPSSDNVSPEVMAFRAEYARNWRDAVNLVSGPPTELEDTDRPPIKLEEALLDIVHNGILHGHDDTQRDTRHQHYSMYTYDIYIYICLHMYTYVYIRNMYIYIHTYIHMIVLIHIR